MNDRLTEENKRLQIQFLEQKQQLEEVNERLKFYTKVPPTPKTPLLQET